MKIGKRGKGLILVALLAVSGAGTGYLASSHGGKGGIGAANAATIPAPFDLLAMFSGRSPGARDPGALTQTKVRERVAANVRSRPPAAGAPGAGAPEERVLTSLRERPLTTGEPGAGFDNLPFSAVDGPLVDATNPSTPGGGTSPGPVVAPPLVVPPTPTPTPTPPVAAVPEPSTWMTMMIGLFGLGIALRRRGQRAVFADR